MQQLRFTGIQAQDAGGRRRDGANPSEDELRRCILRVLEANVLCSMATVTPDGRAHINNAHFSFSDHLDLYFLSDPDSLHCRNLSTNPSICVAVLSSGQRWMEPGRGVQLSGDGGGVPQSLVGEAERSYAARFPGYSTWAASLTSEDVAQAYRFYRARVTAVKLLDEETFGDGVIVVASVARS